jgi:hypothetical protein
MKIKTVKKGSRNGNKKKSKWPPMAEEQKRLMEQERELVAMGAMKPLIW